MTSLDPEYLLGLAKANPELEKVPSHVPKTKHARRNLPTDAKIKLMKEYPVPPLADATTNVTQLRARLQDLKQKLNASNAPTDPSAVSYVEEDMQIPMRDGALITVRIHRPKTPPKDKSPLFVVYHGGGFVLGGLDNEALLCRKWTELGGVAVNVDYRLAPEYKFPIPVNDAYDALKWAASNIEKLNVDPAKGFVVGGISAGANFTAVVTHLYRDDKISPPLTGAWLSIPATMGDDIVPEKYRHVYLARKQNQHAPVLNNDSMAFFEQNYQPDEKSPLRAPFLFPSHADLPPTYFQICGMDPLRDEAFIYEEVLRENYGVKTKVDVYPGLPHSFWSIFPDADFSKAFQKDCIGAMEWLLSQTK